MSRRGDRVANEGNGDGQIDANDEVWPKQSIWVDTDHSGDSTHAKLFTLSELDIKSISLKYYATDLTDKYGNQMRFKGSIETNCHQSREIYDVFFAVQKPKATCEEEM